MKRILRAIGSLTALALLALTLIGAVTLAQSDEPITPKTHVSNLSGCVLDVARLSEDGGTTTLDRLAPHEAGTYAFGSEVAGIQLNPSADCANAQSGPWAQVEHRGTAFEVGGNGWVEIAFSDDA